MSGHEAIHCNNNIAQMYRVNISSVVNDMNDKEHRCKCFKQEAIELYESFVKNVPSDQSNDNFISALHNAISKNPQGFINYNILHDEALLEDQRLINWLEGTEEHMWVDYKGTVKVAKRAKNVKMPHPTLVGGNPDVRGAGVILKNGNKVIFNNKSGHFRPDTIVDSTKKIFKKIYLQDYDICTSINNQTTIIKKAFGESSNTPWENLKS